MMKSKHDENHVKTKLVFFTYVFGGGGAERVFLNIINNIDRDKFEIHLVIGANWELSYLDFIKRPDKISIQILDAIDNEDCTMKLATYLKKEQPDVAISPGFHPNFILIDAKIKAKVKTKIILRESTCRSLREKMTLKNRLKTCIYYNFLCKKVIAISKGVMEDLHKEFYVFKRKFEVIYNPIDEKLLLDMSKENIDDENFEEIKGKKIVAIGRLIPAKDYYTMLNAFKKVVDEKKIKATLIIFGKGELEHELKEYCRELKIESKVKFMGFVRNPHKYLKKADVFAFSSKVEGFGNVILEAMLLGIPVISTNCYSGPSEILDNGKYGFLVNVGDVEALSNGIEQLLIDDSLSKSYRQKALKRIKDFSVKKIAKQYEQVLKK